MSRVGYVSLVITVVAFRASIGSTAPASDAPVDPQQPTVPAEVFRVDPFTGALTPLEFLKEKSEYKSRWDSYCYIPGTYSPVTIRQGELLVFASRIDDSPDTIDRLRKLPAPPYTLEFLFPADNERRYATSKFVPMEGRPYGEVITGVNPKKPKHVGQAFVFRPAGQLPPGDYVLSRYGMIPDGCNKVVSAFRIVEDTSVTQAAPPPPTAPSAASPAAPANPAGPANPAAPTNPPVDIERLRQAAEHGDATAQIHLAEAYASGNGVAKDLALTNQWLTRAADQGVADAQYWLAVMYRDAVGVAPDEARAAELFRKAAEQGQSQAQANLGNLHFFGRGVVQDYVEAHKWLNIAAARLSGDEQKQSLELRDRVAALMTPDQSAEAQKRATEWFDAFMKRGQ